MTTTHHRRGIQYIVPVALAFLLVLGALRVFLDNLRNSSDQFLFLWQSHYYYYYLTTSGSRIIRTRRSAVPIVVSEEEIIKDGCNLFEGKWVFDNISSSPNNYPLYKEDDCPFLVKQVTCQRNGRPDSLYQNWRWQPHGCNLPRFDGVKLVEMIRDKRMMFVGDSIQRGMFESMVCLVQSAITNGNKTLERIPPRKVFTIEEFNATIEYYWAPFMVESISDHATNHTVQKRMVRLDSIAKHAKQWEGVDILIFESYVWWMYKPQINATYGFPDDIKEYNVTTAYRLAMETWGKWINTSSVNQKIFFVTMSPTHLWNWEWKAGGGGWDGNCFNETMPIEERSYWGTGSNLEIMGIVKDVIEKLQSTTAKNVRLLNITQLSEYRKDGHTSIFGERKGKLLTREERLNPKEYADCIHWCLPGVPDTWNEIFYALLLQDYYYQTY